MNQKVGWDQNTEKRASTGDFSVSDVLGALREYVSALGLDWAALTVAERQAVIDNLARADGNQPGWTHRYLLNVLARKVDPSQRLAAALLRELARLDGADEMMLRVTRVLIFALGNVKPGAIVLADSRRCANPTCPIEFVPSHPWQRYHSPDCRKRAKTKRKIT